MCAARCELRFIRFHNMEQLPLVQDVMPPHLAAAKRDVDAIADNYKEAAEIIWPGDPLNGQKRLSNALNGGQKQKLDLHEYKAIADAAALKVGRSHITEYMNGGQPVEYKWVPREVMVERAKVEIAALASQLNSAVSRAEKWLGMAK